MKRVKCQSGIEGYQMRLRESYHSLEEWENSCSFYNLHLKLGYKTPQAAWRYNPMIQGSVNPSDFRKVKTKKN